MTAALQLPAIHDDQHLVQLWLAGRPATTRRVYQAEATALLAAMPGGLPDVSPAHVVEYVTGFHGAPATRARRVSTIKSLLKFAARLGYTATDIGVVVVVPKVTSRLHERMLDKEEVAELIHEAHAGRDRILVRFLYLSGCRISEAVGLRWIDLGPGGVTVVGKGSKVRTVAVPKDILDELRRFRHRDDPDTGWVFRSARGGKLSVRQARHIVSTAAAEALGKPASPHWLRHAHASHALEAGAPLHLVRDTLGHASVATTSKYLGIRPGMGSGMWLVG